jgi:hypothetical protein
VRDDNRVILDQGARACVALQRYLSVPAYLREALTACHLGEPDPRGIY